jgi:hypothetical protein
MCGLGTEIYSGEDVPDKENEKEVVTGTNGGNTLTPAQIFEGRGFIDEINRALPVEAIKTDSANRIVDYDREKIDYEAIDEMLPQFAGKQDIQLWVYENIHTLQNRALRNYEKKKQRDAQNEREAAEKE